MKHETIGFIGAGNMARSLVGGLLNNGWEKDRLLLADPDAQRRAGLHEALAVTVHADNEAVAERASILVFAVKPQIFKSVAAPLGALLQRKKPLVISIAAGIRIDAIERWLGHDLAIVRTMPNTPALVLAGSTGLFANARTSQEQRDKAEAILRAVGVTVWVENESLLDAVTALSGSGPAYFFLIMEALEQAAMKLGLDRTTARLLTIETAYGAAKMAEEGGEDPAQLRARVTSPGGTTESALRVLKERGIDELFDQALSAAAQRSRELADLFGKD
jgi:pyrroline-5-carboxylate reductase